MDLAAAVRAQADACARLGSPMYADVLTRVGEDVERGGVFRDVLAGHEDDPGPSALALRLLGGVHRLVLEGTASELRAYFPSAGGQWSEAGWPALQDAVARHSDEIRARLHDAPQTNEVGRSAVLMGGVMHLVAEHALPLRVFEIGASAGLNLRFDHYCYVDSDGRRHGRSDSPLTLDNAWTGRRVPAGRALVLERLGSDVAPVDTSTPNGRLTLLSYVWPDQTERLHRLRTALEMAGRVAVPVRRQDARAFVEDLRLLDDTTTLLWHSVMWQYLDRTVQHDIESRLQRLGAQATPHRVLAHLAFEPMRRTPEAEREFLVLLRVWPGGVRRVLGTAPPHGVPAVWA